jgi:TetR/AcrR family transcriptional repressor of lmrAB and yxaGH operons
MKKRGASRDRLLATTADLVHRQGYASTGLNQIVDESGAPKGSLYFHFPGGKEQLVAEALEMSSAAVTALLEGVLATAPTTPQALDMIIAYFSHELETSSFTKGCPIATVALEQAASSDPLHRMCTVAYHRWQALIAARLHQDGHALARAAELAEFFLATIEGALMLCRAHRSTQPLRRAALELRRLLAKDNS